jgi:hypothetical protein
MGPFSDREHGPDLLTPSPKPPPDDQIGKRLQNADQRATPKEMRNWSITKERMGYRLKKIELFKKLRIRADYRLDDL